MKNILKLVIVGVGLTLLTGCYSNGTKNISSDEKLSELKPQQSTKGDVKRIIGEPQQVSFDGPTEVWHYYYQGTSKSQLVGTAASMFVPIPGMTFLGGKGEGHTLTLTFNQKGVLQQIGKGKSNSGDGLIGGMGA